jgi:hypothetical protein
MRDDRIIAKGDTEKFIRNAVVLYLQFGYLAEANEEITKILSEQTVSNVRTYQTNSTMKRFS